MTYRIFVKKRHTGETFEGTVEWDGLADLFVVHCDDGVIRYASVLDTVRLEAQS